jgi:hypothetical protein
VKGDVVNPYLPLFLGFLGALLAAVGEWRARVGSPVGNAVLGVGVALLAVVTLLYLLLLLGAVTLA